MIYLDNNSTTQCAPEVVAAMLTCFSVHYANASSSHSLGKSASAVVDKAREDLATWLDCASTEIVFTSGATESNNLVIKGIHTDGARNQIVTSSVEHKSVLESVAQVERSCFQVTYLPVDAFGRISLEAANKSINNKTLLVSIQAANNEVGTIQPIQALAKIAHQQGALFHCDATQALGKIPFSLADTGVDFASFSGHKIYGPKGVGILFVRRGAARKILSPLIIGGSQEQGLRAGTLNVPGIIGFAKAGELALNRMATDQLEIRRLRELFENSLHAKNLIVSYNGCPDDGLPGTISLTIPGIPADMLIANMPAICISTGAACTAGSFSPSHVLLAMGISRENADSTVRISIGRHNTEAEILETVACIRDTALRLKMEMGI
jgi:cysteine desulfurase